MCVLCVVCCFFFFFQAEDGIRVFCLSRGLGDVYKGQVYGSAAPVFHLGSETITTEEGADNGAVLGGGSPQKMKPRSFLLL